MKTTLIEKKVTKSCAKMATILILFCLACKLVRLSSFKVKFSFELTNEVIRASLNTNKRRILNGSHFEISSTVHVID